MRYFGVMMLKSAYGGYEERGRAPQLPRQEVPIGMVRRTRLLLRQHVAHGRPRDPSKHTANAQRDLPGLITRWWNPSPMPATGNAGLHLYRATWLKPEQVDHAIMEMYRNGVINLQRIADVDNEWDDALV